MAPRLLAVRAVLRLRLLGLPGSRWKQGDKIACSLVESAEPTCAGVCADLGTRLVAVVLGNTLSPS